MAFAFTRARDRILGANAALREREGQAARRLEATMFIYEILLGTGILGLVAMALAGFGHGGGAHHTGHGGVHAHHAPLIGRIGAASHAGRAGSSAMAPRGGALRNGRAATAGEARGGFGRALLSLLSPITLFAACLGAGAVGALLTVWGVGPLLAAVGAVVGAIGFNALLVRPLLGLALGFASEPARGLDGTLLQNAEAITNFDANGEGLVRVLVDGQSVDVLARLSEEERRQGTRVVRGQSVRVEDVDTHRNRCTVSRR
jgi:hypothetical protein